MRRNGIFHLASLFLITELFLSYTLSLLRQLSLPPLCLSQQLLLWQYFQLADVLQGPQFLYGSLPHSAYLLQGTAVSMLNQYPHVCSQRPEMDTGLSYMHLNPDQLYSQDSVPITARKNKAQPGSQCCSQRWVNGSDGKGWGLAQILFSESMSLIYYSFVCFLNQLQLTMLSRREPVYYSLSQGQSRTAAACPPRPRLSSCPALQRLVLQLWMPTGTHLLVM